MEIQLSDGSVFELSELFDCQVVRLAYGAVFRACFGDDSVIVDIDKVFVEFRML